MRSVVHSFATCLALAALGFPSTAGEVELPSVGQVESPAASSVGTAHGAAVALSGDLLVIGRPGDFSNGTDSGAVDVYRQVATEPSLDGLPWTWAHQCRLHSGQPIENARFGASVDIDGTTVVVGAWNDSLNGNGTSKGSVWVFEIPPDPPPVLDPAAWLMPPGLKNYDFYGWDVAIDGDVVVAGAWGRDIVDNGDRAGGAWVFERSDDMWSLAAELNAGEDAQFGARFGFAVDIVENLIVVGAPRRGANQGAAYAFLNEQAGWSFVQRLDSPEGDVAERFGTSVTALRMHDAGEEEAEYGIGVGAPGDGELGPQAGAAWGWGATTGDGLTLAEPTKFTPSGGVPFGAAGTSLAVLVIEGHDGHDHGGADGDGGDDGGGDTGDHGDAAVFLGAPGWTNPSTGDTTGTAFVAFGGEDDQDENEEGSVNLGQLAGATFGASVACGTRYVPEWDIDAINIAFGAPGTGEVLVLSFPRSDANGDCNGDGRFDLMEVHILGSDVDCDGNGEHDACQLGQSGDGGGDGDDGGDDVDCDGNDVLDVCQMTQDPSLDCDGNGRLDSCDIDFGGETDCDGNGVLDTCDIAADPGRDCDGNSQLDVCDVIDDPSRDCDGNGILDECDLEADPTRDCDGNGQLDSCEIANEPLLDCDQNSVLDHCQVGGDCDGNGVPDTCEVDSANDCDGNGLLDLCEIQADPARDCDGNGVLDACDLSADPQRDCDGNGRLDECDMADNPGLDCDGNGQLDSCEIQADPARDCDGNGQLDSCEIADDPQLDCDQNGELDQCQSGEGDCDGNGVLDSCELDSATDCNADGVLDVCQLGDAGLNCDGNDQIDSCEIALDPLLDCNANGLLDSCELAADPELDCDGDGVIDSCQGGEPGSDCNENGVPDACEIAGDPALDCDLDGVLDSCALAWDPTLDCDGNGQIDSCEITADPSLDCDLDGLLDACDPSQELGDPRWVTERHDGLLDLPQFAVRLIPMGTTEPPFHGVCTLMDYDVWVNASSHMPLGLSDDDSVLVPLPFSFDYAGMLWNDVYVGSNGYLTFGTPDTTYTETLHAHFDMPRISVLFDDLDPSGNGDVRVGSGPGGSVVVTWYQVPNYNQSETLNTAQVILHPDGIIEMAWSFCDATSAVTGLSQGNGVPPGFLPTDLSNAWDCVARVPSGWGDCNENGTPDACEPYPMGPPHWGVEHWFEDFDLQNQLVRWQANGSTEPPIHDVCATPISELPFDPMAGTPITFSDDGVIPWTLPFLFNFAGQDWDSMNISANGYVTFGSFDFSYDATLETHFERVRISALFADLDPSKGGSVTVQTGPAGSLIVTWYDIPNYLPEHAGTSTAQLMLHVDSTIEVAYGDVNVPMAVTGPSDGLGIPWFFGQTDLSQAWNCQLVHPFDDCNLNGVDDALEKWLGCSLDVNGDGIPDECLPPGGSGGGGFVPPCSRDFDRNGVVDVIDMLVLFEAWGEVKVGSEDDQYDLWPLKGDRRIDVGDLLEFLPAMGEVCE